MKLSILGSGTAAGQTGRNCSGYLVDDHILLDCGPGIWRALSDRVELIRRIDKILLSHFHVDHVSDLIPILWTRFVLEIGQTLPLSLYGPIGIQTWFDQLTLVHKDWIGELRVSIHEMSGKKVTAGAYQIETMPTHHTHNSICYKLTDPANKSIFYSGDSAWEDSLVGLAKSCELAVVEASSPTMNPAADHLSPQSAGAIARLSCAKMLLLTHLYPEALEEDPLATAAKEYSGEIVIAHDGLTIEL